MPEIVFLGTGEAFAPLIDTKKYGNGRATTSLLIRSGNPKVPTIMIDSGYSAPGSLASYLADRGQSFAQVPNVLLLTHGHGDHYGGVSALLMQIWEESNGIVGDSKVGTERKLEILSANERILPPRLDRTEMASGIQTPLERMVEHTVEEDYEGFSGRFKKEGPILSYRMLRSERDYIGTRPDGYEVSAAPTKHGAPNMAYRLERGPTSFAVSGDGSLTEDSMRLFQGVNLLIHEGFDVVKPSKGTNHASMNDVIDYAAEAEIKNIAFVHVNRQERMKTKEIAAEVERAYKKRVRVILPEDHSMIDIYDRSGIGALFLGKIGVKYFPIAA